VLIAVQGKVWIFVATVIVAALTGYALNRGVVARYRARKEGRLPSRLSSAVTVASVWTAICGLAVLIALDSQLWWLWLVLYLVIGYIAVAVVIVRRSRGAANSE
jgi:hypothetical protein